jgi:3-oxoacyl-(acyl-carrier-protein) synthase
MTAMTATAVPGPEALAGLARTAGLAVLCAASWPAGDTDPAPPPLAGFVVSSFSPLVAHVAQLCLSGHYGQPPAEPDRGRRTAVILASVSGDTATAHAVAQAVDAGQRVAPLLFFQSVPNAVAGYIAGRWGLGGPVICLSPAENPAAQALEIAALLIDDGDADEALIVLAEQEDGDPTHDRAAAVLTRAVLTRAGGTTEHLDTA